MKDLSICYYSATGTELPSLVVAYRVSATPGAK